MAVPQSPYVDRIRDFQQSFQLFDLDRNGTISAAELGQALRHLGQSLSPDQAAAIVRDYDRNGDGQIEFAEFLIHQLATLQGQPEAMKLAFAAVDRDRDGFIERAELATAIGHLWDGKLSEAQVLELMREVDLEGDGRFALGELVHLVMREG